MILSTLKFFVVAWILGLGTFVFAQSTNDQAKLIDELGSKYSGEELLSRLDTFAARLSNENAKGVIIFYQSQDPISNVFTYRFLQSHKVTRNVGELYRIVPTRDPSKNGIEFWIERGSKFTDLEEVKPDYSLDPTPNSKPVYFSGELFERVRIDGKWTILGWDCPSVCISGFNLVVLKNFVDANPDSIAYFILRGTRTRSNRVKSHLIKEAKEIGLLPQNTKFLYAGSKKINENQRYVEVEAFISVIETNSPKDFPYQLAKFD